MSKEEEKSIDKESSQKSEPAPPIKHKKHIKYKIMNNSFNKPKMVVTKSILKKVKKETKEEKEEKEEKEIKILEPYNPQTSSEDWSIFSPNFINNTPQPKETNINTPYSSKTYNLNEGNYRTKISKSVINIPLTDSTRILKLESEINGLKETNQNILNLIMEKEKENKTLINNIDKLKADSMEKLSNYLNYIEELGKKFKFSNEDDDLNLDITNNPNETNEINIELNKNKQLKEILNKKNEEFNDINSAIQKLIFNDDSPLLNKSQIKLNDDNKIDNKNEDKEEKNDLINIKEKYDILKDDYNKLIDKYKQNEINNKGSKNRIKFVYKDIPQKQKEQYENTIKELIEENEKIKNDYTKEIENLNISIGSLKVQFLNKQFENETKILNIKKKIKFLIKQCKGMGIKLNNEIINIK